MKQNEMANLMRNVFEKEIMHLREQGQQEYAREEDEAFANFMRVADDLGLDRKTVLWVYLRKHIDGIAAYLEGHESQREDVRGRLNDAIVYLFLLRGMIEEEEAEMWPIDLVKSQRTSASALEAIHGSDLGFGHDGATTVSDDG